MVKTKFKHTDIGLIPEDWEVIYWMKVFDFKSTASYSRADLGEQGKIGYIHYGDIHTKIDSLLDVNKYVSGFISNDQLRIYSLINEGDLIIADASEDYSGVGKGFEVVGNPKIPVISGLHTFLVREKEKGRFAKGFKGYFHNNPLIKKQYNSLATGLKVYSLSKNSFQNIQIPLPPLAEQQAIAEVLSDTDRWIESLENLIVKKQLIKQGAMQKLLTPKEDWEVKKLGEVGEIFTGGTPSTTNKNFWGGSIPWITPTDISTNKNIYIGERNISELGLKQIRPLPENALLVTCIASIGKNAILRKSGACNQQINAVVTSENYSVDYLYYLLELNKSVLQVKAGVTATPILSKAEFSTIEFSFPSIKEQTQIATILSDMDAEIEILEQKLTKAKQIKQGLMQELLTGRKRLCGGFENLSHYADA